LTKIDTHREDNPFAQGLIKQVLVDADVVAYRSALSRDSTSEATAITATRDVVDYIKHNTQSVDVGQYTFYLTGKGNFRHDVAKTAGYKANRVDKDKPEYMDLVRDYLVSEYGAIVVDGCEADDAIATHVARLNYDCITATIDKDFLQMHCWHYFFNRKEWYKPTEWEGTVFFYSQILTGDTVDNIIGLYGIGPVKSAKMLEGATTERELYDACVSAYEGSTERVLENGRLLWLQRDKDELWEPKLWIGNT
jgi:hypothetical protein